MRLCTASLDLMLTKGSWSTLRSLEKHRQGGAVQLEEYSIRLSSQSSHRKSILNLSNLTAQCYCNLCSNRWWTPWCPDCFLPCWCLSQLTQMLPVTVSGTQLLHKFRFFPGQKMRGFSMQLLSRARTFKP